MNVAPFVHLAQSTRRIMWQVCAALLPGIGALCFFDGPRWLLNLLLSGAGAVFFELSVLALRRKALITALDGSAFLTGLLLALSLPATAPPWLCLLGVGFAVVFVKQLYGGLGMNPFNPAMAAFALLLISFPAVMSTHASTWLGLTWAHYDGATGATALDSARMARIDGKVLPIAWSWRAFVVNGAWLSGGLWLAWRRCLDARLIAAVLLGGFVTASFFWAWDGQKYLSPLAQMLAGALVFGACFIATDPVTAATTRRGRWLYGVLIGALTIAVRNLGNFPDGLAFAVLIANACVPLIDPLTQPHYR